jgi:hypothetical protein
MIRVHPIHPEPAALAGADSPAERERQNAAAYWAKNGTMKGFKFVVYKDARVVKALEDAFFGKCAYCEFSYAGGAPCDVEHYRPKGAIDVDGTLTEPGYYWLAAEWTNLLPSCVDCNRARYQEFPDADPELSGKANKFPIGDPAARAKQPGQEAHEERLLLHPYFDDPSEHLHFLERGIIQAALTDGKPHGEGIDRDVRARSEAPHGRARRRLGAGERLREQVAAIHEAVRRGTGEPAAQGHGPHPHQVYQGCARQAAAVPRDGAPDRGADEGYAPLTAALTPSALRASRHPLTILIGLCWSDRPLPDPRASKTTTTPPERAQL